MSNDIFWSPGVRLDHIEKKIILKAMAHFSQNREMAAKSLGISRRTLDGRIAEYKKDEVETEQDMTKRVEMGLGSVKAENYQPVPKAKNDKSA